MLKNLFPNKILSINSEFINNLLIGMLLIVIVGLVYGLFLSPADYIQGDSVRIMYIHVPASFIALGLFGIIGLVSILNLIFSLKIVPFVGKSLAPIGCVFSLISIVTGSLWGKPTWGTLWVWDARLTSMFILFLFYITYIFTWKMLSNNRKANLITSVIGILGLFNIIIVKYSVVWWNTLHQPSSITLTSAPKIHHSMLVPLIIMLVGLSLYCVIIFLMKYKIELIKLKLKKKSNYD